MKSVIKAGYSFLVILMLTQSFALNAQESKKLSVKKLKKDFAEFEFQLEAHPDPYTHISEVNFKTALEKVRSELNKPLTTLDYFKKLASLMALLNDGHSSMHLPDNWMSGQRKKNGAFPLEVHLSNEKKLFITKNFGEDSIRLGTRIIKINELSVDSFLRVIDPYISYEREEFRNTIIDRDFEKYLYVAFEQFSSIKLTCVVFDTFELNIKNIAFKEWKKHQKETKDLREKKIEAGKPYTFEDLGEGIGLINIFSFSARDYGNYEAFLSKTFRRISHNGIHSLIIDIRGNFGGWPKISADLFHYLTDNYFKTMAKSSMKVSKPYRKFYGALLPILNRPGVTIKKVRHSRDLYSILRDPINSYVNEAEFFNEEPKTKTHEFKGDKYVLINRDSYSAASCFASTFQCYQMGTVIGEETGGTKIFRANAIYKLLSKSRIRMYTSTTKEYSTCYNNENEGVRPNVEFSPSILDIVANSDSQLEFTKRLIRKVQATKSEKP